ncbi:MAG: hypothetical protein K6B65_00825 [Bacilli bacterium]|nr:hypothetical protein [Bacilli bacterium]
MEYSTYAKELSSVDTLFKEDEQIDAELGYPEDHEYYEDDNYIASSYR